MILDTPEGIARYQMAVQLGAIKLELKGLKHSRGSVAAAVKRHYGFKGNKQKVYDQLAALYEQTYGEPFAARSSRK